MSSESRGLISFYLNQLGVLVQRLLIVYIAYFISRFVFYLYNIHYFNGTTILDFLRNSFFALRFDTFSIFSTNSLFIFLSILPINWQNKSFYKKILFFVFTLSNSLAIALNYIDVAYYPFIRKRSTSEIFDQLGGQSDMMHLIPQFLLDFWLIVVLVFVTIGLMIRSYQKLRLKPVNYSSRSFKQWLTTTVLFIVFVGISTLSIRGGWQRVPIDMVNAGAVTKPSEVSLVLNTPFSIIKTLSQAKLSDLHYYPMNEAFKEIPLTQQFKDSTFHKKNLVVIVLESFAKEYTQLGKTGKSLTPFLDSLMGQSFVCTNGFSNGTKSIEGIPAILSSLPSWMENPLINSPYANILQHSFAKILGGEGYSSVFYHGGINGTMNFDSWSKSAGYQKYFGMNEYNDNKDFDQHWGILDEPFLNKVADEINQQKRPLHAALFTLSSHHPYFVPEPFQSQLPKGPYENSQSIRYADMALRKFFEKIKQMDWFKNTLFVFSADHGSLSDHPWYVTTIGNESIPIFFYDPSHPVYFEYNKAFSQVDILPSTLKFLGYNKSFSSFGRPIFDTLPHSSFMYLSGTLYYFGDSILYRFQNGAVGAMNPYRRDSTLQTVVNGVYPEVEARMTRYCRLMQQRYNYAIIKDSIY